MRGHRDADAQVTPVEMTKSDGGAKSGPSGGNRRDWVARVAAIIALAGGGLGLYWDLYPAKRPDPRERLGADLKVFAVEPHVAHDAYLRRVSSSKREYRKLLSDLLRTKGLDPVRTTSADARAVRLDPGTVFYVQTKIEGFKRQSVKLRWSMYLVKSRRRVSKKGFQDQPAGDVVDLRSPSDRAVVQIWTPPIIGRGPYFLRIELLDTEATLLAVADSGTFRGL